MAPGLYYGLIGSKQAKTTDEFLVGKRDNSILPVAVSILSSFLSAILILGTPAEIYTQVNYLSAISWAGILIYGIDWKPRADSLILTRF